MLFGGFPVPWPKVSSPGGQNCQSTAHSETLMGQGAAGFVLVGERVLAVEKIIGCKKHMACLCVSKAVVMLTNSALPTKWLWSILLYGVFFILLYVSL